MAGGAGSDQESEDAEIVSSAAQHAPSLGTMGAMRAAAFSKSGGRTNQRRAKETLEARLTLPRREPESVPAAAQGKEPPILSPSTPIASESLRKSDPDMHQVVERLGYIPETLPKLEVQKMWCGKLGRVIYHAPLFCSMEVEFSSFFWGRTVRT